MKIDKRLFRLLKETPAVFISSLVLSVFSALAIVAQAALLSGIIASAFIDRKDLSQLSASFLLLILVSLFRLLFSWGKDLLAHQVAFFVKKILRTRLLLKLDRLGPSFLKDERSGEILLSATEGIETLDAYFSEYLPQLFIAVIIPLLFLLFVFPSDIVSAVVLLLTAPIIPIFMVLIGYAAESVTQKQYQSLSRLSAHYLDVLQGLLTLKIFGRSKDQIATIREVSEEFRNRTMNVLRVAFLSALVLEMVATISTAVVAVEIGIRLLYARMEFQPALFILILAPEFYLPFRLLGSRFHAGQEGVSAAQRIFEILNHKEPKDTAPAIVKNRPSSPYFEIRNVNYRYPGSELNALNDISFKLHQGEYLAVAGISGAGKSTLLQIILGFLVPDSGEIIIEGKFYSELSRSERMNKFTYLSQSPYIFNGTIADNLKIAKPDAEEWEMWEALVKSNLDDDIHLMSEGLLTSVGENGMQLSGGQIQRLAIARAFLKDSDILIFDEATSHLDTHTEEQVLSALKKIAETKTLIVIAHRINTITDADRILLLENGRITEQGHHLDLMAMQGTWFRWTERSRGSGQ